MSPTAFAVVVTFNRLKLLQKCLGSLAQQTRAPDLIIVINNASTDGTAEYLDQWAAQPHRQVIHLATNTGGSGGFSRGLKEAYAQGADWIWVMDDDSVPSHDCLEKLTEAGEAKQAAFVAPIVRWTDGSLCLPNATQADPMHWADDFKLDNPLVRIKSATFVGLLMSRKAIAKVGLPVSQFFIWYDDIEYTLRISQTMTGYCTPKAVVTHMIPENSIPDFSKVNENNLWKHRYGIRNETAVALRTKRFGIVRCVILWMQRDREMRQGLVPLAQRLAVLQWGLKGLVFNYKTMIEKA